MFKGIKNTTPSSIFLLHLPCQRTRIDVLLCIYLWYSKSIRTSWRVRDCLAYEVCHRRLCHIILYTRIFLVNLTDLDSTPTISENVKYYIILKISFDKLTHITISTLPFFFGITTSWDIISTQRHYHRIGSLCFSPDLLLINRCCLSFVTYFFIYRFLVMNL